MGSPGTPFFRFCVGLLLVVIVALIHTALRNATVRLQQERALQEARRWALQRDRDELRALWRAVQPLPQPSRTQPDAADVEGFPPQHAAHDAGRRERRSFPSDDRGYDAQRHGAGGRIGRSAEASRRR